MRVKRPGRLCSTYPLIVFLAACSPLAYKEPASGPRARVRFATDSVAVSVLRTYGDAACQTQESEWMRLRNGYLVNSVPKRLGMPSWAYDDNAAKEVYVEADKPFYGMFQGTQTTGMVIYSCGVPFNFEFRRDTDYQVFFKWDMRACQVRITRLPSTPFDLGSEDLAVFTNQPDDRSRACLEAFKRPHLF